MANSRRFGISGSTLKIIAIVTMLIDHVGATVVESQLFCNAIRWGSTTCTFCHADHWPGGVSDLLLSAG